MHAFAIGAAFVALTIAQAAAGPTPPNPSCAVATPVDNEFQYVGCYKDNVQSRVLRKKWTAPGTMTVDLCIAHCKKFGYPYAGVEYAKECFCDDGLRDEFRVNDKMCGWKCDGDSGQCCGAPDYINVYSATDAAKRRILPVFANPTNKGKFEFLFSAPLVAVASVLTKTNKVALIEGFAPPSLYESNNTHAYELDYSFTDPKLAFREQRVRSDPFCGGIHMIPDQWGRVTTMGGADDVPGHQGIRLYRPTGKPGTNGTTDWQESFRELRLQRSRWYPTMVQMKNGSFALFGGAPDALLIRTEDTVEVVPRAGRPVFLQLLRDTSLRNLYPLSYLLPSGNLFLLSDNRAQILDGETFRVLRELPKIPGSVVGSGGNPLGEGGRTYPNSAAGVILPIYPPYNDPVELLFCGGGTAIGKAAVENCVRIKPEVAGEEWKLERMPAHRVMTNMVALPDLTFLMVNGAATGNAGFATASDPDGYAWLYDPSKPENQRISILDWNDIPRMYHSGAQLLHDGRVLIYGSSPADPRFPRDYRLQMFKPPYITSGAPRPTFTINNGGVEKAFAYGGSILVTATIPSGTIGTVRASLISPGGSTHYNYMGQRSVELTVTSNGGNQFTLGPLPTQDKEYLVPRGNYLVHILDGPTPSEGIWIRIGDPFPQFENWPPASEKFETIPPWTPQ
ncbi:hypothetical protein HDU96_006902 [Phlyctochytrium bullatum]|nr:hypothetical protein HDU96_006902 [Phlyctochytrium bullatum]